MARRTRNREALMSGAAYREATKKRYPLICATCGAKHTEKTARGHARLFGHTAFQAA